MTDLIMFAIFKSPMYLVFPLEAQRSPEKTRPDTDHSTYAAHHASVRQGQTEGGTLHSADPRFRPHSQPCARLEALGAEERVEEPERVDLHLLHARAPALVVLLAQVRVAQHGVALGQLLELLVRLRATRDAARSGGFF